MTFSSFAFILPFVHSGIFDDARLDLLFRTFPASTLARSVRHLVKGNFGTWDQVYWSYYLCWKCMADMAKWAFCPAALVVEMGLLFGAIAFGSLYLGALVMWNVDFCVSLFAKMIRNSRGQTRRSPKRLTKRKIADQQGKMESWWWWVMIIMENCLRFHFIPFFKEWSKLESVVIN